MEWETADFDEERSVWRWMHRKETNGKEIDREEEQKRKRWNESDRKRETEGGGNIGNKEDFAMIFCVYRQLIRNELRIDSKLVHLDSFVWNVVK